MSSQGKTTVHRTEQFERLPSAPIVEAVIHWQAPAGQPLERDALRAELTRRFPEYECNEQQEFGAAVRASADGVELRQKTRWGGFRLSGTEGNRHVVQFKPDGIAFSRLKPYGDWETFLAAAFPFWDAYLELAEPPVIQRLGVRFINQMALEEPRLAADLLRGLPAPPAGLGLASEHFLYQDRFRVAGTPYEINWIRTVQPTAAKEATLIVDIDVSTEQVLSPDRDGMDRHLAEMRALKDKLFFQSMTDKAIDQFRKEPHE